MRSSVAESHPSAGVEVRGQHNQHQPPFNLRVPNPDRPYPNAASTLQKPQHRLTLAPVEGWLPIVLLAIAVYSVVFSISAVGWVHNTFILNWSAAVGLIVGLVIAKINRLPQAILHLAACLIGHWLSVWLTSAIAFHISWGVLIAGIGSVLTDPTRMNNSEIVFLFYLSFLSFFLGYFGAWLVYRAHLPWLVALVYCAIFLINLNYVGHDESPYVVVLLAALILLIARVQLSAKLVQWKSEGLYTDDSWLRGITWRITRITSAIMLLALLFGWLLPVLGQPSQGVTLWNYLDNAWTNISQGHLSLQDPGSLLQSYQAPTNFFGDQLTIAGSVHLPTGEVLHYTSSAAPQYLAGFTYDHFDGHTWTSLSSSTVQNYDANAMLPNDSAQNYISATTSVTIVQPPGSSKHYLFGPSQPASFDVSTTLYGDTMISAWAQRDPLSANEHYEVTSLISNATPQELSAIPLPQQDNAGVWKNDTNYTALQAHYVQFPTDLTPNVQKTLSQWTQGANNTYAALKQIETHLNDATHFSYSLDNPPVPTNIDAADWLLQTHRGYCTYYATEMVVMARLLGIPTRMVNGFSHGYLDVQRHVWVVDGSDAHSWVQAYFPGFGWINFDPTPGFALQNVNNPRPVTTPVPTPTKPSPAKTPIGKKHGTAPDPTPTTSQTNPSATGAGTGSLLVMLSFIALACAVLILLASIMRYWWRNLYPNSSFIAGTFWRLCRVASWVGLSPRTWQTPYEYSRALCGRIPQEAGTVWKLTELFVRERWGTAQQLSPPLVERELAHLSPRLRRSFWQLLLTRIRRVNDL